MQDPTLFQTMKPHFPEQEQLKCPRCDSTNTKFCYYNNYNLSQPRHFCKNCRRYWTKGGALRNIPVGGGSRKNTKRSSNTTKRPTPPPPPSVSSAPASDPDPIRNRPDPVDRSVLGVGGSFSSLLASSGHLGSLLEGLNSSGSNLKAPQMDDFGDNAGSGQVLDPGSGRNSGLGMQTNGTAEGFLSMQNGDSSCWNGTNGWSNLAIYTPSSSFQ
ncbi:hypothetical protein Fmac_019879 [Flemingia macrophylla]|uniref:Dof zinc finger protein n=1 Tax=Flemingia macrophylla TaxID=520843 RepID=A0ABD1M9T6_9FABA